MILSPTYSLSLVVFYFLVGFVFWEIFAHKTGSVLRGLTLSLAIILIGSEYYEIPIFVCAYFTLFGYRFPTALTILNHALVIVIFLIFMSVAKLKASRRNISLFLLGPILTLPFLFWIPSLFMARLIGFLTLFSVTFWGDKHQ